MAVQGMNIFVGEYTEGLAGIRRQGAVKPDRGRGVMVCPKAAPLHPKSGVYQKVLAELSFGFCRFLTSKRYSTTK